MLYETREPPEDGFGVVKLGDLIGCLGAKELDDSPEDSHRRRFIIEGEWYCQNSDCCVREVRITAKWPDGDRPDEPQFECPSCAGTLDFHGHLKTTVLYPVKDSPGHQHSRTPAVEMIAAERSRQIDKEGWSPEHDDDQHRSGDLATAAACYIEPSLMRQWWPWENEWWKPKDRIRDLVRAGALVAAEIDRLLRRQKKGQ